MVFNLRSNLPPNYRNPQVTELTKIDENLEGMDMGCDWKRTRLGDLISITHGYAFKGDDFSEANVEGPIVVTIGNFDYAGGFRFESTRVKRCNCEYPSEYELLSGDILLVMTCQTQGGEILGIPGIIPNDNEIYLHNQRLGKVIVKSNEVSSEYLYWLFLSKNFNHHLCVTATGTKILHTAPKRIESFVFDCPPFSEQKRIAHILGSLDDKIELNRQMNATLEGMAQALFKSWFVDFDPVIDNALAAGNPIPEAFAARAETRRKALAHETANREVAKQFPAAFQFTEEMGWIPEGWEVKSLDKIAEYKNGLALQKFRPNPGENPLPIVKIAQLRNGEATWDELASPNISPECIIHNGDMIFSWSGSLMIDIWCGGKAALNQHLFKVTSSDFPKWFYLNWSIEHLCNFQKIAADKAVTMGHIKRSHLSDANCAIPDNDLLVKASEIITPYIEKIISQRIQNRKLSKLRDTLLPKLISGELHIPEAEKLTEEALA